MTSLYDIKNLWLEDKKLNIQNILSKSLKNEDISLLIKNDDECLSECLTNEKYQFNSKRCEGCDILSNVFNRPLTHKGKAYYDFLSQEEKDSKSDVFWEENISFDFYDGHHYIISDKHQIDGNNLYIIDKSSKDNMNILFNHIYKKYNGEIKNIDYSYVTDSRVYNYIMINLIMLYTMDRKEYNHYPPLLWFYKCRNYICLTEKNSNLGECDFEIIKKDKIYHSHRSPTAKGSKIKMNKNICFTLIKQLTSLLYFLTDYHFNHGDPSIKYLCFERNENEKEEIVEFKGLEYNKEIKLIIRPSMYSSMSLKNGGEFYNFRYLSNHSPLSNNLCVENISVYISNKDFDNESFCRFNIPNLDEYNNRKYYVYYIGKYKDDFKKLFKNNGIGVFGKSMNFCCFLLSMLKDEFMYEAFFNDRKLCEIWDEVWNQNDNEFIHDMLKKDEENNFDNIYKIACQINIRMDLLEFFFNRLL